MAADKPTRTAAWVFSQLHLPRPLESEQVEALLLRLAADRAAPPIVFEARAEHGQPVQHLIGSPPEHVVWIQRTLRDLLPGLDVDGIRTSRQPVQRSVRLRLRPRSLALTTDRAETVSLALLSALDARLVTNERVVLQLVIGPRRAPQHLPRDMADPTQPWWQLISQGSLDAPKPIRTQVDARLGQHGFAATVRIGASAETPDRRHQLMIGVLGALSTAQDRGTYFDLTFEPARRLNEPKLPWRWPLRLGATELSGLLTWPLGERELPGVPPLHPRPLRVPASVCRTERIFAIPAAPGPAQPIGIAASDITSHLITTGPTGSGKSTLLESLIRADVEAGRPVLVVDPKRQLVDDVIERSIPAKRTDDVIIIDPADVTAHGRVVGFNPLDVGDRDPDVVVDGLVAVLKAVFHDGWGPRTEDVVHSGLLTLARTGSERGDPFTLLDLPRLLTDERFRSSLIGHVRHDPGLGSFWAWYLALSPGAQAQAIAAPLNKLRQYLLRPSLRAILGQQRPNFRLRDMFTENKIVLVPLNEALIGPLTSQLLGSLVVAEAWSATLERAKERDPGNRPATVVIDEVQQYLHLPTSIDDALSRSRSLGVGWHLAHQHRAQLPPSTRAAIDSNAKSKVVFRPLDPDDASAMAKQAPELQAIDFLSLGQFQAYANLTVHGAPAGWALVRTLPPPAPTGLAQQIRSASRQRFAAPVEPSTAPSREAGEPQGAEAEGAVGRKRRRS